MNSNQHLTERSAEEEATFGLKDILALVGFIKNSVFRHKILMVICLVCILAFAFFAISVLPRKYEINTRIMTYQSSVISELARTGRRFSEDETTSGVPEIMKSRRMLKRIVEETNMPARWKDSRHKIGRVLDKVRVFLGGVMSEEDYEEMLIETLDSKLEVYVENKTLVLVRIQWHDAENAYEIMEKAIELFFEDRERHEFGEVQDTIRILEKKRKKAQKKLEEIAAKNKNIISETSELESKVNPEQAPRRAMRIAAVVASGAPIEEINRISTELKSVESEIDQLRSSHKARLQVERQKLAQIETMYGPKHPEIIKSKRYIELLSQQKAVPSALEAQKQSLSNLLDTLKNPVEDEGQRVVKAAIPAKVEKPSTKQAPKYEQDIAQLIFDSELMSQEYRSAELKVISIEDRLVNARMELEASEAAFDYRYRLTKPAVLPKNPISPNPIKILAMAIILSMLLGTFFAVFVDVRSGRIIESWQIEKIAGLPLLGEIDEK